MKNIMLAAAFITFAGLANADTGKSDGRHDSQTYQQKSGNITADTTPDNKANTATTKRLPGRDCKLYEGGIRQHTSPQYEIGNLNRPECPAA